MLNNVEKLVDRVFLSSSIVVGKIPNKFATKPSPYSVI